ncbi:hypothetical protein ACX1C1_12375 [Paenibacillus sp. strain BS8-2]
MAYAHFFLRLILVRIRGAAEYRGAFLLAFAAKAIMFSTDLLLLWLLIRLFGGIAGWGNMK